MWRLPTKIRVFWGSHNKDKNGTLAFLELPMFRGEG